MAITAARRTGMPPPWGRSALSPMTPGGPTSPELAVLFERIFARYPTASAIGFATIPSDAPGGVSLAALNRMIEGAVRGVMTREGSGG